MKRTTKPRRPIEPVETAKVKAKNIPEKVLFYDYLKHGRLQVGEALILYWDGSFKKAGNPRALSAR
jgi:hypothetical protein